jgi:hypothetical protein
MVICDNRRCRHYHFFCLKTFAQAMSETTSKMGRPTFPKKERRWKFISTRISQGEYQEIVNAARESGMSKTKWVGTKPIAAARRA